MKEYIPIDSKSTRKSTRILAIIFGIILMVVGVFIGSIYTVVVGAIMFVAMLLKKKTVINENGLEVTYDMMLFKHCERWKFCEIEEIHKELSPDGQKYALHIMRGVMSKRVVFLVEDAQKVLDLAREKNSKIHIANVDM